MFKSDSNLNACAYCGAAILKGEMMDVCPSCGAFFCEHCCKLGRLENHNCDELDYED